MKGHQLLLSKCFQIHFGMKVDQCIRLKFHDNLMTHISIKSYLSNVITLELSNNLNIRKKVSKALGTTSENMTLLIHISQSHHCFCI